MFYLPGRLRIYVKGLYGNGKFAERINQCLTGMKGIKKAAANQYTGNLLVFFSEEDISISYIEKEIHEIMSEMDSDESEPEQNLKYNQSEINNPAIIENIKRVYNKLIPLVFAACSIFFIVSGNLLVPLSVLVLVHPYMVYLSAYITLRSAAANAYLSGIFINSPARLELAAEADTIVFDSTGLLTSGKYEVSDIITSSRTSRNRILLLAASCCRNSEDPIAKSLVEEAAKRNLELMGVSNAKVCTEKGISCNIDNKHVQIGSRKQFAEKDIFTGTHIINERKLKHFGQYPVFVAYDHKIIGLIALQSVIEKGCIPAIEAMREAGIEDIRIISEENEEIVKNIALAAGIESYEANLNLESKMERIAELADEGRIVGLIRSEFLDYEPMQASAICIAFFGPNSDLDSEYSDFVIFDNDLRIIPQMIGLSKFTREVVLQNCIISLGLDAIGVILVLTNAITPYMALLYKLANNLVVMLNARKPVNYKINNLISG